MIDRRIIPEVRETVNYALNYPKEPKECRQTSCSPLIVLGMV